MTDHRQARSQNVNFRVTPEEHERLKAESREAGLSLTQYTRARMLGDTAAPRAHVAAATYASLGGQLAGLSTAIEQARRALDGEPTD